MNDKPCRLLLPIANYIPYDRLGRIYEARIYVLKREDRCFIAIISGNTANEHEKGQDLSVDTTVLHVDESIVVRTHQQ